MHSINTDFGGLTGFDSNNTTISCYWDTQLSGIINSPSGIGKNTFEMNQKSTFIGWDFTTYWDIHTTLNNGYPYFVWQGLVPLNPFETGDGTINNPFQVANAIQLNEVRNYLYSYFVQIADIDIGVSPWNQGLGWIPIGDAVLFFEGNYNGNNYNISGLTIKNTYITMVGLFGWNKRCTLKNINIIDALIDVNPYEVGALVGRISDHSIIINCSSSGNISSTGVVGGLVGDIYDNSHIYNSYSTCNIDAFNENYATHVGGLTGSAVSGCIIENCYATGSIQGIRDIAKVGGLIGNNLGSCPVINCYSTGNISGTGENVGGLIGLLQDSQCTDSYWDIETSSIDSSACGIGKTTA
ncbi:MAG: hypothetical protein KKD38_09320 [Candidatus Delongbacteria bacterium]|nr:hypothetical protein [Candidatus Delongbacteria bacterium]